MLASEVSVRRTGHLPAASSNRWSSNPLAGPGRRCLTVRWSTMPEVLTQSPYGVLDL